MSNLFNLDGSKGIQPNLLDLEDMSGFLDSGHVTPDGLDPGFTAAMEELDPEGVGRMLGLIYLYERPDGVIVPDKMSESLVIIDGTDDPVFVADDGSFYDGRRRDKLAFVELGCAWSDAQEPPVRIDSLEFCGAMLFAATTHREGRVSYSSERLGVVGPGSRDSIPHGDSAHDQRYFQLYTRLLAQRIGFDAGRAEELGSMFACFCDTEHLFYVAFDFEHVIEVELDFTAITHRAPARRANSKQSPMFRGGPAVGQLFATPPRATSESSQGVALTGQRDSQYQSLSDAAAVTGDARYQGEGLSIWYMRPEHRIEASNGFQFMKERGYAPTPRTLGELYVKLGEIDRSAVNSPVGVFGLMQGEVWSPTGNARTLIGELGLAHTSMSQGDMYEIDGVFFMIDRYGAVVEVDTMNDPESSAAYVGAELSPYRRGDRVMVRDPRHKFSQGGIFLGMMGDQAIVEIDSQGARRIGQMAFDLDELYKPGSA